MTLINTEAKADLVCSEGPAAEGEEDVKDKHHAILYNILFRKYQAHVLRLETNRGSNVTEGPGIKQRRF